MFRQLSNKTAFVVVTLGFVIASSGFAQEQAPIETRIDGPDGSQLIVRMQGPYDAEVSLQVACYFERTPSSDAKLFGAPVELDRRLGGLIASLRERGEFKGDEFETLLIQPSRGSIRAKQLLLIGLGNEADLSLKRMENVGRTALREAVRVGASHVAFAPLIKDAGSDRFLAGDVENAVTLGMLLAYDTERRLQKQRFAAEFRLDEWIVEAGPTYFAETVVGVRKGVEQATQAISERASTAYSNSSN